MRKLEPAADRVFFEPGLRREISMDKALTAIVLIAAGVILVYYGKEFIAQGKHLLLA